MNLKFIALLVLASSFNVKVAVTQFGGFGGFGGSTGFPSSNFGSGFGGFSGFGSPSSNSFHSTSIGHGSSISSSLLNSHSTSSGQNSHSGFGFGSGLGGLSIGGGFGNSHRTSSSHGITNIQSTSHGENAQTVNTRFDSGNGNFGSNGFGGFGPTIRITGGTFLKGSDINQADFESQVLEKLGGYEHRGSIETSTPYSINLRFESEVQLSSTMPPFTTSSSICTSTPSTTIFSTTKKERRRKTTTKVPEYDNNHHYGRTFGSNHLTKNTYISQNKYFEYQPPLGPGPLAKAMFSKGYMWGFSAETYDTLYDKRWNKNFDRKWRATTRAPYFQNKVPGEGKILPANAVIGAATAFGLVSLLPLRVPSHKPLMYCGNTNLTEVPIRINSDEVYTCKDDKFVISCIQKFKNPTGYICSDKILECGGNNENIYCSDGILMSHSDMYCDSTSSFNDGETKILNCFEEHLPIYSASFIPTTSSKSEEPTSPTTAMPKELSLGAKTHLFLMNVMGKSIDLEKQETTTMSALSIQEYPFEVRGAWHPEALTMSPPKTGRGKKILSVETGIWGLYDKSEEVTKKTAEKQEDEMSEETVDETTVDLETSTEVSKMDLETTTDDLKNFVTDNLIESTEKSEVTSVKSNLTEQSNSTTSISSHKNA